MEFSEARKLIFSLDPQQPLCSQMEKLYVPALLNQGIVERSSTQGILAVRLNQYQLRQEKIAVIRKIFATAVKTLEQIEGGMEGIPLSLRFRLYQELRAELISPSTEEVSDSDLSAIERSTREVKAAQEENLRAQSLLRDWSQSTMEPLTASQYAQSLKTESVKDVLNQWRWICGNLFDMENSPYEQRISLMQKALTFKQSLDQIFPDQKVAMTVQERLLVIQDLGKILLENIQNIPNGGRWLFAGSYGINKVSWKNVVGLLKKLPEAAQKNLPSEIRELISKESIPSPDAFVRDMIHTAFEDLRKQLPEWDENLDFSSSQAFFQDPSRELPAILAQFLPENIENSLNEILQKGVLGNTAALFSQVPTGQQRAGVQTTLNYSDLLQGFGTPIDHMPMRLLSMLFRVLPGEMTGKLMDWISRQGDLLNTPESREAFFLNLENQISHLLEGQGAALEEKLNRHLRSMMQQVKQFIPAQSLGLLGLDQLFSGEFWLEFVKQPDGNFSVFVYGTGSAAIYHPLDDNEKPCWPLHIANVPSQNVSEEFCHRLLYHSIEPSVNPQAYSKAENLYEGVLKYLEGSWNTTGQEYFPEINPEKGQIDELVGAFLLGPSQEVKKALYSYYVYHFTAFFKPYLTGPNNTLVIPSQEVADLLLKGCDALRRQMGQMQDLQTDGYRKRLQETIHEIEKVVEDYQTSVRPIPEALGNNPLNLSPEIIQWIRQAMHDRKIRLIDLQSAKPILEWAFGDEVGVFVDTLVTSLGSQTFTPPVAPSLPADQRGWLSALLTHLYSQVNLELVRYALDLARLYRYGFGSLVVGSVVDRGLRTILPEQIYQWYLQALRALKQALMEFAFQMILNGLFSPQDAEKIRLMGIKGRDSIRKFFENVNGTREVDLAVTLKPIEVTGTTFSTFTAPVEPQTVTLEQGTTSPAISPLVYSSPIKLDLSNALSCFESWKAETKKIMREAQAALFEDWKLEVKTKPSNFKDREPQKFHDKTQQLISTFDHDQFEEWAIEAKKLVDTFDPHYRLSMPHLYLVNQLELLDIPSPDTTGEGWWDQVAVEEIPTYMQALFQLGCLLQTTSPGTFTINTRHQANFAKTICSSCNLLCLMDRLARRSPDSQLENNALFTYPLLYWWKKTSLIAEPQLLDQMRKIFNYFFQKDLADAAHMDLSEYQNRDSLLTYSTLHLTKITLDKFVDNFFKEKKAEYRYLKRQLEDPEVVRKCQQLNILDQNGNRCDFQKLSEKQQIAILFRESTTVGRADPILPPSYVYLRLQNLLTAYIIQQGPEVHLKREIKSTLSFWNLSAPDSYRISSKFSLWKFLFTSQDLLQNMVGEENWKLNLYSSEPYTVYGYYWKKLSFEERISESKVMVDHVEKHQYEPLSNPFEREFFILARSEQTDQLIRFLEFVRTHKHRLKFDLTGSFLFSYFEQTMFERDDFFKQMKAYPHLVQTIGNLIREVADDGVKAEDYPVILWTAYMGYRLKKYCQGCLPEQALQFPDLLQILNTIPKTSSMEFNASVEMLRALIQEIEVTENLDDAAKDVIFFKARFACRDQSITDTTFLKEVLLRIEFLFNMAYQKRLSKLEALLSMEDVRNLLGDEICASCEFNDNVPLWMQNSSWKRLSRWELQKDGITLNLIDGHILSNHVRYDALSQILNSKLATLHPRYREILFRRPGFLSTPDNQVQVTYEEFADDEGNIQLNFQVKQFIEGKAYSLPKDCSISAFPSALFSESVKNLQHSMDVKDLAKGTCWIEESDLSEKGLLVYLGGVNYYYQTTLKKDPQIPDGYLIENTQAPLLLVPQEEVADILQPLRRFCSLAKIKCWRDASEPEWIAKIEIASFDLKFKTERWGNERRVVSEEAFPNYSIAPQQLHPYIKDLSSYLLLENRDGHHLVLIPNDRWAGAILQRILPLSNILSPYLLPLMKSANQNSESSYFSYRLDASGRMTSSHPQAVIYLLLLSVLQGNLERADDLCSQFEMLSRHQKFHSDFTLHLIPLCLAPFDTTAIRRLRCRLFAALEENRLTHHSFNFSSASAIEDLLLIPILLLDLQKNLEEPHRHKKLTLSQEWFLFHSIFNRCSGICKELPEHSIKSRVLEMLRLAPNLMKRFHQLEEHYGHHTTKDEDISFVIHDILQMYSRFPQVSPLTLPGQFDTTLDAIKVLQTGADAFLTSVEDLNLDKLFKEMQEVVSADAPFTLEQLTAENFKKFYVTYYAIARGDAFPEKRKRLQSLLLLLKGGWDYETNCLMGYLEAVMAIPRLFPKSQVLITLLSDKAISTKVHNQNELKMFFSRLHSRTLKWKGGSHAVQWVAKKGLRTAINMASYSNPIIDDTVPCNPVLDELPLIRPMLVLATGIRFGTGHLSLRRGSGSIAAPTPNRNSNPPPLVPQLPPLVEPPQNYFQALEAEDQKVDDLLNNLFNTIFSHDSQQQAPDEIQVTPFEDSSGDAVIQDRFNRVNASIGEFQRQPAAPLPRLRFKGEEALWNAYRTLLVEREMMKAKWQKEQQLLMASLNGVLPPDSALRIENLRRAFLDGDFRSLAADLHLPAHVLKNLEMALARHFVKAGRLSQLDRLVAHFEMLAKFPLANSPRQFQQKIEDVAKECKAKREYSLSDASFSLRVKRHFLCFEAGANVLLWKKQVDMMKESFKRGGENLVMELIMGLGKSTNIIPLEDAVLADGNQILVNVAPKAIAHTFIGQTSSQSKKALGQDSSTVNFDRSTPLDGERVDAWKVVVMRAKEQKETLNGTKEDFMSMQLRLQEWLYYKIHSTQRGSGVNDADILQLRDILLQFRRHGKLIGDECQDLFYYLQELNHPLGEMSKIQEPFYLVLQECMIHLCGNPTFMSYLENNDLENLPKDYIKNYLLRHVALNMSTYTPFNLSDIKLRQEFITYVTGQAQKQPESLATNPQLEGIDLVKGFLGPLLELVCSSPANVKFGNGGEEFARPFDGNMNPVMNSVIQNPYETLVKTFIFSIQEGLNVEQLKKLVKAMHDAAADESSKKGCTIAETEVYEEFSTIFKSCDLETAEYYSSKEFEQFCVKEGKNLKGIFKYLHLILYKKIHFWKLSLSSNAQNLFSMFATGLCDTGTPYNDGTYPAGLSMLWDLITTGQALHMMTNRCPQDGIHILENSQPRGILREALATYFAPGSRYSALIDGGALLKGLDTLTVAQAMITHCVACRPDIKAVVFFQKNASGKDELVYLEHKGKPKPFAQCPYSPVEYLTYFDDCHTFAANVPQEKDRIGLKFVGSNSRLFKEMQAWFRMRELKSQAWVLPINEDDTTTTAHQEIHVAMTKEVQQQISGDDVPTLRQIFEFAIRQEALEVARENYESYRQKVDNVIKSAVFDKILACKTVSQMVALFKEFMLKVFVKVVEDNPSKLYGWIAAQKPTGVVLEAIKNRGYDILSKSKSFSKEELKDIKKQLDALPLPIMPKEVTVFMDGQQFRVDALDQLGKQVEVHQNQDQNHKVDQQLKLNVMITQNQESQVKKVPYTEFEWSSNLDPYSVEWMTAQYNEGLYSIPYWKTLIKPATAPPFFRACDLLQKSHHRRLSGIGSAIDDKLRFSNNFLPRVLGINETPVEIGSKEQRHLFEVLVDLQEKLDGSYEILSIGALSLQDASFWRGKLSPKNLALAKSKPFKRVLYSTSLRTFVAGDAININSLIMDPLFQKMEVQLMFLDGNPVIPDCLHQAAMEWVANHNIDALYQGWNEIYHQRGRDNYKGSFLESLFKQALIRGL